MLFSIVVALVMSTTSAPAAQPVSPAFGGTYMDELATDCCKTCHTGKACGDSCISKDDDCTKGAGCACDG